MQLNPERGSVITDVSDVGVDGTTVSKSAMSGTFYLACLACDQAGLLFIMQSINLPVDVRSSALLML
ncbi:hypothetical protein A1OU_22010 [Enterovibrio norvegicus]|nr:hypothetical protein A1OU_22010 [Enterovibrio norvegicus]